MSCGAILNCVRNTQRLAMIWLSPEEEARLACAAAAPGGSGVAGQHRAASCKHTVHPDCNPLLIAERAARADPLELLPGSNRLCIPLPAQCLL